MKLMKTTALATIAVFAGGAAYADCGIESGNINILGNDFAPIQMIVEGAMACASDSVTVEANLTTEHRDLQVAALTANPAQYTSAIVANSSIVPLMNEDLIRPLDDLVEKYGQGLNRNQLITIDGKVMAIAFMANAQHLYVREDILAQAGLGIPSTYEEVIAAAQKLEADGIMQNPFVTNTATGWNLGEEFVNMYLGHGGAFFEPGTANVSINNEAGIATLETMKALTELSNPDFLTFDSNASAAIWEAGEAALGFMWGSRAAPILDDEGSTEEVTSNTRLVGAPTVAGGDKPASTLWWDGFTISKNISDEDAEATFRALMNGLTEDRIKANNDMTVWLAPGYTPTDTAAGVFATANSGASPYPMIPFMGLLHSALGNELSDFLQGSESAEQALADVEAAYTAAAKEQGFLQ